MKYEIIMWTADWCGPCADLKKKGTLKEALAAFTAEVKETVALVFIDVDEDEEAADEARVQSMPTVDLMRDGKRIDRAGPMQAKEYVKRWLKAAGKK